MYKMSSIEPLKTRNKKGALQLSMGTMVVIVLLVATLILGLVLVNKIFSGVTESTDVTVSKVQSKINNLFSEKGKDVIVKLGPNHKAQVKQGTSDFNVGMAAITSDDSNVDSRSRLQYKITLSETSTENCLTELGEEKTRELIKVRLNEWNNFNAYEGPHAYANIGVNTEDIPTCTQEFYVDVTDTKNDEKVGGTYFKIQVVEKGFGVF